MAHQIQNKTCSVLKIKNLTRHRLSGLSPFMGETDVETMANVTVAQYDFDDEAFDSISNDAKDFIKKLLVKDHKYAFVLAKTIILYA